MTIAAPVAAAIPAPRTSPAPIEPTEETAGTMNFMRAGRVREARMIRMIPSMLDSSLSAVSTRTMGLGRSRPPPLIGPSIQSARE